MPLPKVCEAPKTAEVSTDSTLKTDNKSVEKLLAPDFWQFRLVLRRRQGMVGTWANGTRDCDTLSHSGFIKCFATA